MTITRQIKERPILFSGEMVKAILAGRKTQTRRVLQQPRRKDGIKLLPELLRDMGAGHACPYGVTGDRLYVRETFAIESNWNIDSEESYPPPFKDGRPIKRIVDDPQWGDWWEQAHYKATDPEPELCIGGLEEPGVRWRPSIHMPRWASRIMLEIVDVRVERVQDISFDDAMAEGIHFQVVTHDASWTATIKSDPREGYAWLWNKLNAARGYGWDVNPWVWVIEFKKLEATQCPA